MRESRKTRDCFCAFCVRCYRTPKFIKAKGTLGSHEFIILKVDMILLQIEISVAIANHKLISNCMF
jgi:hypothetical protein